jgi:hypothetical protein
MATSQVDPIDQMAKDSHLTREEVLRNIATHTALQQQAPNRVVTEARVNTVLAAFDAAVESVVSSLVGPEFTREEVLHIIRNWGLK